MDVASSAEESALEPWSEWLQRTTHKIEDDMNQIGLDTWVVKYRKLKLNRAKQTLELDDNRWSKRALLWNPGQEVQYYRQVGRPKARWDDCLNQLAYTMGLQSWTQITSDTHAWNKLHDVFLR